MTDVIKKYKIKEGKVFKYQNKSYLCLSISDSVYVVDMAHDDLGDRTIIDFIKICQ